MIKSPSKFLSRNFLNHLRHNNYTSLSGIEYSALETDDLYFEKTSRLSIIEAEQQFQERFNGYQYTRRCMPPRFYRTC